MNFLFTITLFSEFVNVQLFINCHKVNQNPLFVVLSLAAASNIKIISTTERGITLVENVYFLKFSWECEIGLLVAASCPVTVFDGSCLCSESPISKLVEMVENENYLPRCVKVMFIWEIKVFAAWVAQWHVLHLKRFEWKCLYSRVI